MLAWRFPLAAPEWGFMSWPPLGLDKLFGRLYAESGIAARRGRDASGPYSSVGLELNAIVILGYAVPLGGSLGVVHGLDGGGVTRWYLRLAGIGLEGPFQAVKKR
jgi:hypothetical protein